MKICKNPGWKLLACGATLLLAVPALPQGQQGQGQGQTQGPVIKAEVNLVNLFATVRDKNKRVIMDLNKDDFKIYEDGHEEQIAFFSREMTMPITLGLLLDTSGSEQNMLGAIQDAGDAQGRRGHGDLVRYGRGPAGGLHGRQRHIGPRDTQSEDQCAEWRVHRGKSRTDWIGQRDRDGAL